jgi:hypothetical protein
MSGRTGSPRWMALLAAGRADAGRREIRALITRAAHAGVGIYPVAPLLPGTSAESRSRTRVRRAQRAGDPSRYRAARDRAPLAIGTVAVGVKSSPLARAEAKEQISRHHVRDLSDRPIEHPVDQQG